MTPCLLLEISGHLEKDPSLWMRRRQSCFIDSLYAALSSTDSYTSESYIARSLESKVLYTRQKDVGTTVACQIARKDL